jgi:hypothetical protein
VEHYLRTYCNFEQDNWATHLSLAEFVYNTSFHSATNTTPSMALLGFSPRGPGDIPPSGPQPVKAPAAEDRAKHLRSIREERCYGIPKPNIRNSIIKAGNHNYLIRITRSSYL